MPDEALGKTIRALLETERSGVLATLSASRGGWPFASVAPYALTGRGEPLLLLSSLAEHTRNVQADSRASLLVQDHASLADPQAGSRITILGRIEPLRESGLEAARERYLGRHPRAAARYVGLGDFRLYVLRVGEARFIGGFGEMGWLAGEQFLAKLAQVDTTRRGSENR
jgi:putative heme iron utilization protein